MVMSGDGGIVLLSDVGVNPRRCRPAGSSAILPPLLAELNSTSRDRRTDHEMVSSVYNIYIVVENDVSCARLYTKPSGSDNQVEVSQ